jgi:hypothetical protein
LCGAGLNEVHHQKPADKSVEKPVKLHKVALFLRGAYHGQNNVDEQDPFFRARQDRANEEYIFAADDEINHNLWHRELFLFSRCLGSP